MTPNDMNNGKAAFPEFHDVYIDPISFEAYRKTGKLPDGTILVKELASVGAKSAASGNGYFPGEFIGVAAAVKDSKRFAKEPGNWAYFKFIGADGTAKRWPRPRCSRPKTATSVTRRMLPRTGFSPNSILYSGQQRQPSNLW